MHSLLSMHLWLFWLLVVVVDHFWISLQKMQKVPNAFVHTSLSIRNTKKVLELFALSAYKRKQENKNDRVSKLQ